VPLSDVANLTVEASWSTNPDATPAWETIDTVDSISVRGRGRTYELDESTPAIGRVEVDNVSGTYTAGKAIGASSWLAPVMFGGYPLALSSAATGTVTTDKRIRATVDLSPIGGSTYTLFDHVITACPTSIPGGFAYSSSEFSTVDYLDALGGIYLRSPYYEHTLYEGPTHYWPLGDDAGSTSAVDVITGTASPLQDFYDTGNALPGVAAFGGDPFFSTDSTANLAFAPHLTGGAADAGRVIVTGRKGKGAQLSGTKWGVRLTFATANDTDPAGYLFYHANYDGTADNPFYIFIGSPSGNLAVNIPGVGIVNPGGATAWNDGAAHTIQVIASTTQVRIWMDGVLTNTTGAPTSLGTRGYTTIGGGVSTVNGLVLSPYTGRIGHVAFFDSTFIDSGKSFTDHYAASQGFTGDTVDTRINRVLGDWVGYTGTTTIDTSTTVLGAQESEGLSALDEILKAARSDDGIFYVEGDGTPRFRSRTARYTTSPVVALGSATLPVDASDLTFEYDRTLIVNDFYATRPGGGTYRFVDDESVAEHRRRTPSGPIEFNVSTDAELEQAARWYLYRYSQPRARVGILRLNPYHDTALAQWAASLRPFDRISVTNLPATAPATTMDFIVEQVSHPRIGNNEWTTELAVSPWLPVLKLDDATYGALDAYPLGY
jgi:hypothetical protein